MHELPSNRAAVNGYKNLTSPTSEQKIFANTALNLQRLNVRNWLSFDIKNNQKLRSAKRTKLSYLIIPTAN
jgi:hypothetical protein